MTSFKAFASAAPSALGMIPGIGQGLAALSSLVAGGISLFGGSKPDLKSIYESTKKDIKRTYAESGSKLRAQTRGVYDSAMGEMANKSTLAGAISGVANMSRVSASSSASVMDKKNQTMMANERMLAQQEAGALQQAADKYAYQQSAWEVNKPGFESKVLPLMSALGDEGVWNMVLGSGTGIGKLFSAGENEKDNFSGTTGSFTNTKVMDKKFSSSFNTTLPSTFSTNPINNLGLSNLGKTTNLQFDALTLKKKKSSYNPF